MSASQSSAFGSRVIRRSRLCAIDLIGASELLISWPMTRMRRCQAWRSSSRSERLTSVSTSSSSGNPPCRKTFVANLPAPGAAGERRGDGGGVLVLEARRKAQCVRHRARCSRSDGRASSRSPAPFTRRSRRSRIEREHGDRYLLHHRAQEPARVEGAHTLRPQRVGERVDLDQHLAERIVPRANRRAPDREVLFAQRRQQVRDGLQREHHAVAQRDRHAPPERDDQQREGPSEPGGEIADQSSASATTIAGQPGAERHQETRRS